MASAASRAKEKGEGGSHHPIPEHQMGNGCSSSVGRGGGTWQERGRLGDTEVISHRNHLRKGNFHTKLHLEHLAEKLKLLGLDGDRGEKEKLCSWRKRTFPSNGPRDDGGPTGAPIKESVQEDVEQIHSDLENLKKQKEELLELKRSGERRCQDLLTRTEAERQKILSEFRQLRRFLKEKEMVLVARLGELDRAVLRRQEEEEAKVEGDISLLGILICEMEEKLKQPTHLFLSELEKEEGASVGEEGKAALLPGEPQKTPSGSGGIRTHAPAGTGALIQRLRPLGHATPLETPTISMENDEEEKEV
uniref:Uncharacterized protein n=1 Tax=Gallus gallus TaxID=9031 RepID=A5HUK8_CHICK|nr:hypothetical protein [Gallus gallus]